MLTNSLYERATIPIAEENKRANKQHGNVANLRFWFRLLDGYCQNGHECTTPFVGQQFVPHGFAES
jgi:hypothetical protein